MQSIQKQLIKLTEIYHTEIEMEKNIQYIQSIDDIRRDTEKLEEHRKILNTLHESYILNCIWFFQKWLDIRKFATEQYITIRNILHDHIHDLILRLAEQKQTLEHAKSELERSIQWTPELEQVSELQKARLDRQIEQFEELQRILVKA